MNFGEWKTFLEKHEKNTQIVNLVAILAGVGVRKNRKKTYEATLVAIEAQPAASSVQVALTPEMMEDLVEETRSLGARIWNKRIGG